MSSGQICFYDIGNERRIERYANIDRQRGTYRLKEIDGDSYRQIEIDTDRYSQKIYRKMEIDTDMYRQ